MKNSTIRKSAAFSVLVGALTLLSIVAILYWPSRYVDIKVYKNLVTYTVERRQRFPWLPGPRSLQEEITLEEFERLRDCGLPAYDRYHVR